MIEEDFQVINLHEDDQGNFFIPPVIAAPAGHGIARPQDIPNHKHYRINLMALASQNGQILMDGMLPFSNLFHSFQAYGSLESAMLAYDNALEELKAWMRRNNIDMRNARRLPSRY
jgi:hypothetical protein